MSVLTATTLISAHGAIWNYPGCWHQMYPQINGPTWPKCWPNVNLMLCSVLLAIWCLYQALLGGMSDDRPAWPTSWPHGKLTWDASMGGMPDDRWVWPTGWPNGKLTWDATTGGYIWQVYVTNVVTHMTIRCLYVEGKSGWHFVC